MAIGIGSLVAPRAQPQVAAADKIAPSELWTKLASSKRPLKEVDFPRKDPATGEPLGKLGMRPLTQGEIIAAQAEAIRYARTLIRDDPELASRIEQSPVYQNACACEILFRACRRLDNPDLPIFPVAASVRDPVHGLTTDECGILMNTYEFVQLELGPIAAYLTTEMQDALIKRLQEGGSALPLATLSLGQWSDLTLRMAFLLSTSPTDSGSPGTQPDEPSTSSNE